MKRLSAFPIILMTMWFTACHPPQDRAAQYPAPPNNAIATAAVEPLPAATVPASADVAAELALEPSPSDTPRAAVISQPAPEVSPPTPARQPVQQPSLPALPELIPAIALTGYFPEGISWSLGIALPEAAAAVAVLSQPAQIKPLTAEHAAITAQKYGFDEPLFVEYRTGFTMDQLMDTGMFIAFDGPRSLSLWGRPYVYSDASHQPAAFDLPFAQALPIAQQFLQANGWLSFPYETAESQQGEGVLFFPIIDDLLLSSPAYAVRVADDGGVAAVFIYPQENLAQLGRYPILTADAAWQKVLQDPNQRGVFYQIDPPASQIPISYPPTHYRLPAPGTTGTSYNNIWVYRPLMADAPPIITSSSYFRITGDPAMLEELAAETDYLVKLTGTARELAPGLQTLELTNWQLVPDAGGLPFFSGRLVRTEGLTYLDDAASDTTYLLPEAPAELQIGVETIVAGLPQAVDGVQVLDWQEITAYPSQAETIMPTPIAPMRAVSIDSVKLVYLRMPAHVSGRLDDLHFPAWQYSGTADNGEQVTLWVTAVPFDYSAVPDH